MGFFRGLNPADHLPPAIVLRPRTGRSCNSCPAARQATPWHVAVQMNLLVGIKWLASRFGRVVQP
jgi:hypothetical protein